MMTKAGIDAAVIFTVSAGTVCTQPVSRTVRQVWCTRCVNAHALVVQ